MNHEWQKVMVPEQGWDAGWCKELRRAQPQACSEEAHLEQTERGRQCHGFSEPDLLLLREEEDTEAPQAPVRSSFLQGQPQDTH